MSIGTSADTTKRRISPFPIQKYGEDSFLSSASVKVLITLFACVLVDAATTRRWTQAKAEEIAMAAENVRYSIVQTFDSERFVVFSLLGTKLECSTSRRTMKSEAMKMKLKCLDWSMKQRPVSWEFIRSSVRKPSKIGKWMNYSNGHTIWTTTNIWSIGEPLAPVLPPTFCTVRIRARENAAQFDWYETKGLLCFSVLAGA